MPDTPIAAVIGLPPEETVRAFEARDTLRSSVRWSEVWHGEHARSFTVAKVAKLDLLATIRKSIDDVIRNGGTLEQWQASLIPELQKAGWWGLVTDSELTGADHPVFVGPRRLRTIFNTNLRVSRAAGHWARIQELKGSRPYLMYTAIADGHTRPLHRKWGGLEPGSVRVILPVDHPCWAIYFPPNDWGCRCTVRQLSDRDLVRLGLRVTTDDELKRIGWLSSAGTVGGRMRNFHRAGSSEPVKVPVGVGPGFAYNPGAASMTAVAEKALRTLEETARVDAPAARSTVDALVASEAFVEAMSEAGAAFPVMVLDDASRAALGAEARVATLSSETFASQRARDPDMSIGDYRRLPQLGADADIVAVAGDTVLKLVPLDDGRWLLAIVRRSAAGDVLSVTTSRVVEGTLIERLLDGATVIYDRR